MKDLILDTIKRLARSVDKNKHIDYCKVECPKFQEELGKKYGDVGYTYYIKYLPGYKGNNWALDVVIQSPNGSLKIELTICDSEDIAMFFSVKSHGIMSVKDRTLSGIIDTINELNWI